GYRPPVPSPRTVWSTPNRYSPVTFCHRWIAPWSRGDSNWVRGGRVFGACSQPIVTLIVRCSLAAVQEGGIVTGCQGVVKLSKSIGNYELGLLEVRSRRCRSMERSQDSSRAIVPAWDDSGSMRVASLGCSLRF